MLLNIQHETVYRYSTPVDYTIQHLRLTPRTEAHQQAIDWKITAPGKYQRHLDAYGNVGHILVLDRPHQEIRITVSGQVEISQENAHLPSDGGEVPLLVYLQPTHLTTANEAIMDLAQAVHRTKRGAIDSMFKLIDGIQQAVAYIPGASQVTSTAVEVLAAGAGVCQDHAHVFIACCRALDLPARYVSGYIPQVMRGRMCGWKARVGSALILPTLTLQHQSIAVWRLGGITWMHARCAAFGTVVVRRPWKLWCGLPTRIQPACCCNPSWLIKK
jgi:transglutaminase-like putative cysteine protease